MQDGIDKRRTWDAIHAPGRPFIKMHGLRNHVVIVDARAVPFRPEAHEIVALCDPAIGVGADQLVVLEPAANDGVSAFVRFYNVDGPEAEACGNATRCVSWLLMEEQGVDSVRLQTRNGVLQCRRTGTLEVCCEMGRLSMDWQQIPLTEARDTCHLGIGRGPLQDPVALSIGNPHAVFFVDDLDTIDLQQYAPSIQGHRLFPNGVNVGAAELLAPDRLRLQVFERGAGLTAACGSGACAAAFAALARGLTDERTVTVEMPAGSVRIEILADGSATMTGPVAVCFSGNLNMESES